MAIIAVIAEKGGAGKTPLPLNLAITAVQKGLQGRNSRRGPTGYRVQVDRPARRGTSMGRACTCRQVGRSHRPSQGPRGVDFIVIDTPALVY